MIISNCLQGSEAWENLRRSKLTASNFKLVLGKGDFIVARLIGDAPDGGFGRAKKQAEVYDQLAVSRETGDAGIIAGELNPSGLKGLIEKKIAETYINGGGCTLKKAAAIKHIDRLICEAIYTDAELGDRPPTDAMERGTYLEDAARVEFENETGIDVRQVGFVMHEEMNLIGASPDGLAEDGGTVEIKCQLPPSSLHTLLEGKMPNEFRPQVHGQMAVAGAKHGWFVSYCPGMPTKIIKVERSDYTENLLKCLGEFDQLYRERREQAARLIKKLI